MYFVELGLYVKDLFVWELSSSTVYNLTPGVVLFYNNWFPTPSQT